jgi:ABC-type sugar transport system permease subunit
MVTPVGIAYTFRMLADMSVGPVAPVARFFPGALTWAQDAWSARWVVLLSDTWQWTPFMFIVLLAAIEGQSREQVEAAQLDGASSWRIFRDITWPASRPAPPRSC